MKYLLPKLGLLQQEILDWSMEERGQGGKGESGLNEKEEDLLECSYFHICILIIYDKFWPLNKTVPRWGHQEGGKEAGGVEGEGVESWNFSISKYHPFAPQYQKISSNRSKTKKWELEMLRGTLCERPLFYLLEQLYELEIHILIHIHAQ